MTLKGVIARAQRALREDLKLHLVAISSLTVAFLCLALSLLVVGNLDALADQWQGTRRMTIFLEEGVSKAQIGELQFLLASIPEVRGSELVTSDKARADFLAAVALDGPADAIGAEVFPASIELTLAADGSPKQFEAAAERIGSLAAVDEVETYATWFSQLHGLIRTGEALALGLALIVFVCSLAVVASTIRLSLAGRGAEIEVMKLCGATDRFVQGPFVVEGVFQGLAAAVLAVAVLLLAFVLVRGQLDASLLSLLGGRLRFLSPLASLFVLLLGAASGAVGSVWSLRRSLAV